MLICEASLGSREPKILLGGDLPLEISTVQSSHTEGSVTRPQSATRSLQWVRRVPELGSSLMHPTVLLGISLVPEALPDNRDGVLAHTELTV